MQELKKEKCIFLYFYPHALLEFVQVLVFDYSFENLCFAGYIGEKKQFFMCYHTCRSRSSLSARETP